MRNPIHLNAKAIVSTKGQVVIPRIFREAVGLHAGSELIFELHKNGLLEIKIPKRSIDMFFGRCKRKAESALSIADMDKAIAQAVIKNDESSM